MKKLKLDAGVAEYQVGCGVLRFNPADPGLFIRLEEAAREMEAVTRDAADLQAADRALKALFNRVFGADTDMDRLLGGVSLLAAAGNGKTVLENLLSALEPVLLEGAKACADALTQQAKAQAERRRGGR